MPFLSDEARDELGLITPIPKRLKDALAELEKDEQWAKGFMGEDLYKAYFELKEYEEKTESAKEEKARKLGAMEQF